LIIAQKEKSHATSLLYLNFACVINR